MVTGNVLTNDTGSGLTVIGYGRPHSGSVGIGPGGDFTYKPVGPRINSDDFTYTVRDSAGQTATATVYIGQVS